MKFDPQKHHRHSIRVPGYNYASAGGYFVTIVSQGRACLFGEIRDGEMILNDAGRMVQKIWETIPERFVGIELGAYIIMPNHFHPILIINEPVGATLVVAQNRAGTSPAPTKSTLGDVIGAFKSITTHKYIQGVKESGWPPFDKKLWQRNYYEHIIRNDDDYQRIQRYIESNPSVWAGDEENPVVQKFGIKANK